MTDTAATRPYGVLGRVLGHSYTPTIYKELAGLEYVRFEREPEDLEAFMTGDEWEGTNVTIPYKRAVMEYLDELSPLAERMGNVNTITRLPDGRLHGDNTDYFGFQCLVEELGVEVAGKKALVLGATGGAGTTASMVLGDMGAIVVPVGRTSEVNYDNIAQQSDASLLVNCTPAGMFPHCPDAPCTLEGLDALEGVIDIVYNPARTGLMLEAERRGIPCIGGLLMLVAQAAQAVERYTGKATPRERILDVTERLSRREQNIALIGMPGSGKTRVGEQIAQLTGREHIDLDRALEERLGMPCADFIIKCGEAAFREQETAALADISKRSGLGALHRRRRGYARRELPSAAPKQPNRDAQPQARRARPQGPPHHRARRHRQAGRAAYAALPRLGRLHHRLTRLRRQHRPCPPRHPPTRSLTKTTTKGAGTFVVVFQLQRKQP